DVLPLPFRHAVFSGGTPHLGSDPGAVAVRFSGDLLFQQCAGDAAAALFRSRGRAMIDFAALASAVHMLSTSWQPWMVVVPGILIGLLIHAVPGLTTSMALAICLPLVPYMDFLQALIFM